MMMIDCILRTARTLLAADAAVPVVSTMEASAAACPGVLYCAAVLLSAHPGIIAPAETIPLLIPRTRHGAVVERMLLSVGTAERLALALLAVTQPPATGGVPNSQEA